MPSPSHISPILVATDLSHRSDRAVQRAFALGRQTGARVIAFAAVDDAMPEELTADLHRRTSELLKRHVSSLADGVDHETRTVVGDPTEEILRVVADVDPGLLIMGLHRPRGFLDNLRDTTMQRIVRRTGHPVLLVRDLHHHDYRKIVAATDFSPAATHAISLAAQIAPDARITPVHALQIPFSGMLGYTPDGRSELEAAFIKETRQSDAAWRAAETLPEQLGETRIVAGSGYAVINRTVAEEKAELVCVGAHSRAGAALTILGSLATDLMRTPPCDLLIARP